MRGRSCCLSLTLSRFGLPKRSVKWILKCEHVSVLLKAYRQSPRAGVMLNLVLSGDHAYTEWSGLSPMRHFCRVCLPPAAPVASGLPTASFPAPSRSASIAKRFVSQTPCLHRPRIRRGKSCCGRGSVWPHAPAGLSAVLCALPWAGR